jgi:hypothetical protein
MATVQGLIDQVKTEAQFDVTDAAALLWLDRRHKKMVVRARAYRKTATIAGGTVSGQRDYALPSDLIEVLEINVGGLPYGRATHTDLSYGAQGWVMLSGIGGVASSEEDATGGAEIALYPTPTTNASVISVRGIFRPSSLAVGQDSTIVVPDEFLDSLVSGAIATGLQRQEYRPDLAQAFEQDYENACEEWRRQVRRRYRGAGPTAIRIQGVNI